MKIKETKIKGNKIKGNDMKKCLDTWGLSQRQDAMATLWTRESHQRCTWDATQQEEDDKNRNFGRVTQVMLKLRTAKRRAKDLKQRSTATYASFRVKNSCVCVCVASVLKQNGFPGSCDIC